MSGERGYTLVEVMIFLAVSSVMFISAMLLINGQQDRVRFSQGMRDIDSKIQDIINDVSTGYYPTYNTIQCSNDLTSTKMTLSGAGTNQDVGQNKDCIILGKVIHFSPGNLSTVFNLYTVVGLRAVKSTQYNGETYSVQVTNLLDAKPTAVVNPDITEKFELQWGIKLKNVVQGSTMTGFYTSLGGAELTGADTTDTSKSNVEYKLKSGSQNVQAIDFASSSSRTGYAGPSLTTSQADAADIINNQAKFGYGLSAPIILCFEGSNSSQQATLTIGESGRAISTKLEFKTC